MLVILAGLFFAGTWLAFANCRANGIRQSFLYTSAIYTLCVVLTTELFSVWGLLSRPALGVFWGTAAAMVVAYLWFSADRGTTRAGSVLWKCVKASPVPFTILTLVLAATLLTALVAPPNSWDSMAYHMSRVAMWLQRGSVAHYPTPYLAQLYHPPLTEWLILHLHALADGDRFANIVQWMAFAGCGIAASLLAREFQAGFGVQLLAAVIALTLPTAVLQATSSLNDVMAAYWPTVMALFAIQYVKTPTTPRLCFCGLALGFALLCKGTSYVFVAPIGAVLFLRGIVVAKAFRGRMKLVIGGVAIVAIALLLNIGHYARNLALFDNPLTYGDSGHINEHFNVNVTYSNLVRSAALHLGVPNDRVNACTLEAIRHVFGEGLDAVPGATRGGAIFTRGILWTQNEALAGNFLHFWTLLASTLATLLLWRRPGWQGWPATVALAVVLATVTFCSLIQWDLYGGRRHDPLFMLGACTVALCVAATARLLRQRSRKNRKMVATDTLVQAVVDGRLSHMQAAGRLAMSVKHVKSLAKRLREQGTTGLASGEEAERAGGSSTGHRLNNVVAALFFVAAVPSLLWNVHRPLYASPHLMAYGGETKSIFKADRGYLYFNAHPSLRGPYMEAIAYLAELEPREIGLYMNADDFDYTLFPLLQERLGVVPRIEHVRVANVSGTLADNGFTPEYVFSTRGALDTVGGTTYRPIAHADPGPYANTVTVLKREDADRNSGHKPLQALGGRGREASEPGLLGKKLRGKGPGGVRDGPEVGSAREGVAAVRDRFAL